VAWVCGGVGDVGGGFKGLGWICLSWVTWMCRNADFFESAFFIMGIQVGGITQRVLAGYSV
jgi:hypothetical protein